MLMQIQHFILAAMWISQTQCLTNFYESNNRRLTPLDNQYTNSKRISPWPLPTRIKGQQRLTVKPTGIKLPRHYMHSRVLKQATHAPPRILPVQRVKQRQNNRNMPTFDYVPGQDVNERVPLFVFSGTQGAMLLNTMLSARRYPMHEPIPGQILYPPTTPMFRPKPILSAARLPNHARQMNLTLIPFYAHEAITPNYLLPEVMDIASSATTQTPRDVATTAAHKKQRKLRKKRKHKKAKQYAVYRAADEVHWLPSTVDPLSLVESVPSASTTTPFPLSLISPLESQQQLAFATELPTPTTMTTYHLKPTTNAEFLINYAEESVEKPVIPMTTPGNVHSSRYTTATPIYAFPVYTLGKLLNTTQEEVPIIENEDVANTWFVLNSRYKGPHKSNSNYSYSSKYTKNQSNSRKEKGR